MEWCTQCHRQKNAAQECDSCHNEM
jgi:hypothetical protein